MMCVRGTHITGIHIYYCDKANSVESSLQRAREIHKTRQPYWKHRSTHNTSDMCTGVHISYTFPTHVLHIYYSDNASSLRTSLQTSREIHTTRQPYWKGVHISLVICVRGYTYHGDTYTIVTTPVHYVIRCRAQVEYT